MLKIKDEVDLKELEKFGFIKDYIVDQTVYRKISSIEKSQMVQTCEYIIWKDRGIDIYSYNGFLDNTLYDLIQANLVEKVSDR